MQIENQTNSSEGSNAIDISNVLSGLQQQRASAQTRLLTNRRRIHRALKRLNATHVVVSYSGCGDSGQIDSIRMLNGDVEIKPFKNIRVLTATSKFDHQASRWIEQAKNKSVPILEALETLVYDWLESEYAGWENNDGASGDCTIDVAGDSFLLEHTWYYTESETAEHSL